MLIPKRIKFGLGFTDSVGLSMGYLSLFRESEIKRGLIEFSNYSFGHYRIPGTINEEKELDKFLQNNETI